MKRFTKLSRYISGNISDEHFRTILEPLIKILDCKLFSSLISVLFFYFFFHARWRLRLRHLKQKLKTTAILTPYNLYGISMVSIVSNF